MSPRGPLPQRDPHSFVSPRRSRGTLSTNSPEQSTRAVAVLAAIHPSRLLRDQQPEGSQAETEAPEWLWAGSGGAPPAQVHTPEEGNAPLNAEGAPERDSNESPAAPLTPPSRQVRRHAARRAAEGRPVTRSWRGWVAGVANELRVIGRGGEAIRLQRCGTLAQVWDCHHCGEACAHARVAVSCDQRVCPWCARRATADRVERVCAAARRVPDLVKLRAEEIAAELDEGAREAAERRDVYRRGWFQAAGRAARRSSRDTDGRAVDLGAADWWKAKAKRAEWDRRHCLRRRGDARGWRHWSWKLITVSPKWKPADPAEYTVAGLRRRIEAVWAAWARVWRELDAGGLAAAVARVECSDKGHVHVHALVFAPFRSVEDLASLAGCYVDARAVRGDPSAKDGAGAVREAVKYALKVPSPRSVRWFAGDPRVGAGVVHPRLAARWQVALERAQSVRWYGTMRDAHAAAEAAQDAPEPAPFLPPACPHCGIELPSEWTRTVKVAELAEELRTFGREWLRRLSVDRAERG